MKYVNIRSWGYRGTGKTFNFRAMSIVDKIKDLGLELPAPAQPAGNYVAVNVRGNIAYVAIQFPKKNGELLYKGRLGLDLSIKEGYKAMELCALNVLSQLESAVGLENILGINHMDAYYQAHGNWDEAPKLVDGASDLFTTVLGEKGIHSRAIFGVERLSKNFSVGITCSFTLK